MPGQGMGRTEWAILDTIVKRGFSERMTYKF